MAQASSSTLPPSPGLQGRQSPPLTPSCFPALETQVPQGPSPSRAVGSARQTRPPIPGLEMVAIPPVSQATDTNPRSDLSASAATATADFCTQRGAAAPGLAASRAAALSGLGISEAGGWWGGAGEHGWPPGAMGWPRQCHVLGKTAACAKSSVGGGHGSARLPPGPQRWRLRILSAAPWLQAWLPGSALVLRTPCTPGWCRVALGTRGKGSHHVYIRLDPGTEASNETGHVSVDVGERPGCERRRTWARQPNLTSSRKPLWTEGEKRRESPTRPVSWPHDTPCCSLS